MKKFVLAVLLSISIASLISITELAESSAFGLEFRTIDGSGNNIANSQWGQAGQPLERLLQNGYDDGLSTPRGGTPSLPSARVVSNFVSDQNVLMPDPNFVNNMFWDFGQFIDHDIDLTGAADPQEPFNIPVPIDDPVFDGPVIPFDRSVFVGDGILTTRQQLNGITAYIDASNVYGSDTTRADYLREFDGSGKLKTSLANNGEVLLPFNLIGLPNAGGPMPTLFIAGDVRANEQVGLTALHILFVREHNRIADDLATRLAANEPALLAKRTELNMLSDDEFFYQSARAVVGAQIQIITYEEFLPMLLGPGALGSYGGYDSSVNSQIANSFSTAAYRFGHTMVSPELTRLGDSPVPIATAFFNPQLLVNDGADSLLGGMGLAAAQEVDTQVIDGLRNFLFGPGSGLDLASLNIQRGRDHGLPSYNDARMELSGISPVADFLEMTGGDANLAADFASAYNSVNDVDLWAGGLAEPAVNGGMVGETFFLILVDQFERLRDGDRFFYLNNLSHLEILDSYLEHTSLSKIIVRNTVMESMPANMFIVPFNAVGGTMIPIDTTSLLLAGTQMTASWMIPVIVSAIGIGIVIARKF